MIKERLLSLPDDIEEMRIEQINADKRLQHYVEEVSK